MTLNEIRDSDKETAALILNAHITATILLAQIAGADDSIINGLLAVKVDVVKADHRDGPGGQATA